MSFRLAVAICCSFCAAHAQERSADLERVIAAAQRHPVAYPLLQELCDEIGPRLTGSASEARAEEWSAKQMRSFGLEGVHREPWSLEKGWTRGYARARLLSPFPLELLVTSYGWSGSTTGEIEAEVALFRSTEKNWAGKVLLVTPQDLSTLAQVLSAAQDAHAAAVVFRDRRPGMMLPHTGPISFPGRSSGLAVLDIAAEQEDLILRVLHAGRPVRVRVDVKNAFTAGPVSSSNVVGEIRGSLHPEEVVLLGAHLDSWDLGTGAIDDGFGVAAVLGAAKTIAESGVKPQRTIRFVLFTGEEQGLLGSRAYVRAHQTEMRNVVCALVLDWGNGPVTKFPLAGHDEMGASFEQLFRQIADVAPVQVAKGFMTYTDAFAFTLAGVAGIAPLQDSPNYSTIGHSSADTLDKVQGGVLEQDSALLAMSAVWLANEHARASVLFPPEKTAESLRSQETTLRLLELWPF